MNLYETLPARLAAARLAMGRLKQERSEASHRWFRCELNSFDEERHYYLRECDLMFWLHFELNIPPSLENRELSWDEVNAQFSHDHDGVFDVERGEFVVATVRVDLIDVSAP